MEATYNYKGLDIDLCMKRYELETEELSKIYILVDPPKYDHTDTLKFYIDCPQIITCAPTSAFSQTDFSMTMGISEDQVSIDHVLAFKWRRLRSWGRNVVLFVYQMHIVAPLLLFGFVLADHTDGPSDFLFDDSCREKSVTKRRLMERARGFDWKPFCCTPGRLKSFFGGYPTSFQFSATSSVELLSEYKLLSGDWILSLRTEIGENGEVSSVRCSVSELDRPAVPDVCYLKQKDGKLVPVSSMLKKCRC